MCVCVTAWQGNCWQTMCHLKCLCGQHNTVLTATGCSELRFGGREGLNWSFQFVIFCDDSKDRQALPNLCTPSTTKTECFVVSRKMSRGFHTYIHIYILHGAESFLRSWPGFQLVKKFPAFYGTRKFITAFTRAHHLSVPVASSVKSIPHIPLPEDPS